MLTCGPGVIVWVYSRSMKNIDVAQTMLSNGQVIPQLGLGTYLVKGETCESIVLEALKLGYRHIDTAMVYQNEAEVGRAIERSGIDRESLFVTTKLANTEQTDVQAGFERSLDRLGLDYVDMYLLHWPLPQRKTAIPAWEEIVHIGNTGRAKTVGVCNFEIDHLERLIEETGVTPVVNQIELHPEHQRTDLVAYCAERGIAIEAWGPLAQAKSDLLNQESIVTAAKAHGKTPGQVVLRWHLERGNIVIPKTQTPSRLSENLDIFDFALTETEQAAINALETGTNYGPNPFTYDG